MAIDSSSSTPHHHKPGEEITPTVSSAVSEATNPGILDVPPLYESVNWDSVSRRFDSRESDGEIGAKTLALRALGCRACINRDEQAVAVSPGERVTRFDYLRNEPFRTHNRGGNDSFCVAFVEAARPTSEQEIEKGYPALFEAVDLDCLSRLFRIVTDDVPRDRGWISFTLDERTVIVEASGERTFAETAREQNTTGVA